MSHFPIYRPRRLRRTENLRRLVRETKLDSFDLIMPYFVVEGTGVKREVSSMPDIFHFSVDMLVEEIKGLEPLHPGGIILFGIPSQKDESGYGAYTSEGIIPHAIKAIKSAGLKTVIIADLCLCEYTTSGHCGVIKEGRGGMEVDNEATLELLAKAAISYAEAGVDMVAPSDMMDGRVGAIRRRLDESGYTYIPIMSYTTKYASSFYGPFREAAQSAPQFGDRKSYQMDFGNQDEAIREAMLDIEEGADIIMVKPAMAYLDVLYRLKHELGYPTAAYSVSGEYVMIKSAAQRGLIDEKGCVLELLTGIKRAGADMIITYFAKDAAGYLS